MTAVHIVIELVLLALVLVRAATIARLEAAIVDYRAQLASAVQVAASWRSRVLDDREEPSRPGARS